MTRPRTIDVVETLVADLRPAEPVALRRVHATCAVLLAAVGAFLAPMAGVGDIAGLGERAVALAGFAAVAALAAWVALTASVPGRRERLAPGAALVATSYVAALSLAAGLPTSWPAGALAGRDVLLAGLWIVTLAALPAAVVLRFAARLAPDRGPAIAGAAFAAGAAVAAALLDLRFRALPPAVAVAALTIVPVAGGLLARPAGRLLRRLAERNALAQSGLRVAQPPRRARFGPSLDLATLGAMPQPLLVLFGFLVIEPLWSISFLGWPWDVVSGESGPRAALILATYWLLPWAVAAAIYARSFAAVPLFIIESVLLATHAFLFVGDAAPALSGVRLGLIGAMAVIGLLFGTKDYLYPLMSRARRGWRRAPRLHVTAPLYLVDGKRQIPLVLQNCSVTGLCAHGAPKLLTAHLGSARPGELLTLRLRIGRADVEVRAELAWLRDEGPVKVLGVRVRSEVVMERFIGSLKLDRVDTAWPAFAARLWVRSSVRRAALAAWIVSLAGAFGSPACQQKAAPRDAAPPAKVETLVPPSPSAP